MDVNLFLLFLLIDHIFTYRVITYELRSRRNVYTKTWISDELVKTRHYYKSQIRQKGNIEKMLIFLYCIVEISMVHYHVPL